MMIFHNPGLIDLDAVRTMGVSVKRPGSFGYFGTGLKFAIATILRGGGTITIWRGEDRHEIGTKPTQIRDEDFDLVCLDGEPMGITTQLGRNWEPWMVLRELGCNALDEGGEFYLREGEMEECFSAKPDITVIAVEWDELDKAFADRGNLFLDRSAEPIIRTDEFEAFDSPSQFIYYRGIRAFKMEKAAMLTYNLLSDQTLTEDRNLYGTYALDEAIKAFALKRGEMAQVERLINPGSNYHEASLSFSEWEKPSRAFVDAAISLRERGASFNDSARKVMLKALRQEEGGIGGSIPYKRITSAPLEAAVEALGECGIGFDMDETPIIAVDELAGDAISLAENGRIYIVNGLLDKGVEAIAYELLRRWIDGKTILDTADEAIQLVAKPLFNQSATIRRAREYEALRNADDGETADEAAEPAES